MRLAGKIALRLACVAAFGLLASAASNAQVSEYELKAALLYKVAKFVRWPASAFSDEDAPLVFCVLGEDPFGASLDAISGQVTAGRSIVIERHANADAARDCHLAFISASEHGRLPAILETVRDRAVLTVGDTASFATRGGAVNFVTQENRIAFEINAPATERAGLEISAQLMRLARIINLDPVGS